MDNRSYPSNTFTGIAMPFKTAVRLIPFAERRSQGIRANLAAVVHRFSPAALPPPQLVPS